MTGAHDPRFQALVARRRRLVVALSAFVAAVYTLVALGCAFAPGLLRRPVVGEHVSLGIVAMLAVIVVGIASAGYYTWWCNTVRDPLAADLLRAHADGRG